MSAHARTLLMTACVWLMLGAVVGAVAWGDRLELKALPDDAWEPIAQKVPLSAVAAAVPSAPVVDGLLDEATWKQATRLGTFKTLGGLDASASSWVDMQAAVHENVLYLGARLANPGAPLRALITENGGRVWTDDCLELFFRDPSDGHTRQLTVNGNGAWWSGMFLGSGEWKPNIRAAAKRQAQGWTVEMAIPLADLPMTRGGRSPVAFQARYLVRNQSAYVSWASGQSPSELGLLCFEESQLPTQRLQIKAVRMPSELPAGGGDVGVRFFNPTAQPRAAAIRLFPATNVSSAQTQRVTVAPGQSADVTLRVTPPASPKAYVLLAQDGADGAWNFRLDRSLTVQPDFRLSLLRERFWVGEQRIEGDLELGVPAQDWPQHTLSLSLFSRTQQLAQLPATTLSARRYALSIDLRDLPVGTYKLLVERRGPGGVQSEVKELNLQQTMALPARKRVNLRLDWPEGVGSVTPVYCGLALPGGMLADVRKIRVVDDRGQEVPAQIDPLATWSPVGSLRWVGVRFTADKQRRYVAEIGSAVTCQETPAIKVTQTEQLIVIDTGSSRWELPRIGPLLGKAWIGTTQALSGDRAVLVLQDQSGRIADETRNTSDEKSVVELAGPQHVVIRREGLYRTNSGERLGKYVVRVTFDAGSSVARVQHSFIVTENSDQVQYADVSVRVAPSFSGPWRASLPHGTQRHEATLDPTRDGLYLAQLVYPHFQKPDSRYQIGQRSQSNWTTVAQGEVAGNWIAAQRQDGGAGVAVAIRDFVRTFPKELQIVDGSVIAHLWSNRGGRLLDYRPATLVEHWGREWSATYPGGIEKLTAIQANAAGTARTHDVTIQLLGPDSDLTQAQQNARRLEQPVLAIQDPQWLRSTEALGPLHPYDPQRFGRIEAFARNVFKQLFVDQAVNCGDFGYLDFGNGPHTLTRVPTATPGINDRPRMGYRYTNMDYHGRTAMWLAYARSGDRLYFDYAQPFTRHLYDYRFSYFTGPKRKIGSILGGGVSEDVPMYWAGWTAHEDVGLYAGHQGIDLANLHMQYFLTGDRRAMDGPTLFAQRLIEDFDPYKLPNVGSTSSACMALALPAQTYFQTWDDRIGRKLLIARQRALDLRTTTGLANQDYYGALYKWPMRHWGTLEDYKVTGAALSRASLLTGLPLLLHDVPEPTLGYQDHSGAFANYAAQWTGDPRWASWIHARISKTVAAFSDEQGNIVGSPYAGTHNFNFPQLVAYGLDVIAREQNRLAPYPLLNISSLDRAPSLWLRKAPSQDVTLHVHHEPEWDLRVAAADAKFNEWRASYYPGAVQVDGQVQTFSRLAPGRAEGTLALRLPPDAIPGDYQLTGIDSVLAGNAEKLVALVREGAYLEGNSLEPERWFLQLPAQTSGKIFVSRACELRIGQQTRTLTGGQWHDVANQATEPVMAMLAVRGLTYVRLSGKIPAVLAAHDESRYFVPRGVNVEPVELPEPISASVEFAPGRSGREGDRAAVVSRSDLSIPVGKRLSPTRWQCLDATQGTLEFWYQPRWSSDLAAQPILRPFIQSNVLPFSIEYGHQIPAQLDGRTRFMNMGALKYLSPGAAGSWPVLPLLNPTSLQQGKWTHIAICWTTDAEGRGFRAELYRDGQGSGFEGGGRNAAGPMHPHESEPGFKRFTPREREDAPTPAIWLMSQLDGAIDDLRVSDEVRYPKPFDPSMVNTRLADEHTLLLLKFDGDLRAITPQSKDLLEARRGR